MDSAIQFAVDANGHLHVASPGRLNPLWMISSDDLRGASELAREQHPLRDVVPVTQQASTLHLLPLDYSDRTTASLDREPGEVAQKQECRRRGSSELIPQPELLLDSNW